MQIMLFLDISFDLLSQFLKLSLWGMTGLGAFRAFVRFALVWFCLCGVWEGLRFVIPGLSSYPFFLDLSLLLPVFLAFA